jgi:hypothetical protein
MFRVACRLSKFFRFLSPLALFAALAILACDPAFAAPSIRTNRLKFDESESGPRLSMPRPGGRSALSLQAVAASSTQRIPLFDSEGKLIKTVSAKVTPVTDDRFAVTGVVSEVGQSLYATVYDTASERFFQASVDGGGAVVSEVSKSELALSARCGLETRAAGHEHLDSADYTARLSQLTGQWRKFELYLVSSSDFSENRSEEDIAAQIANTIATSNIYFSDLELIIEVVGVSIMRAENDTFSTAIELQDAYAMIDTLQDEWRGVRSPERDAIMVFAKSSFDDVYGLAYTASACIDPDYAVGFATQGSRTLTGELSLGATLAHELGHIIGMNHDPRTYNDLPSLMYSFYAEKTSGFSARSISEYVEYAGPGEAGGSCLEKTVPPVTSGGSGTISSTTTIRLKEGSTFVRRLETTNSSGKINYSTIGLPKGASFDSVTGTIAYRPGYSVASSRNKSVEEFALLRVTQNGKVTTQRFRFVVSNRNRVAQIRSSIPTQSKLLRPGSMFSWTVRAVDPDREGDVALEMYSKRTFASLPGQKVISFDGKRLRIRWRVPQNFVGSFSLGVRAVDKANSVAKRTLDVFVQ